MPRVLRILNRLIIGGPALNATYLTKYMAPDWETQLVIGGKDDHEQEADHLTQRLGITPVVISEMKRAINVSEDRKAYLKLKNLIQEFKPDVVHTHAAKSGALGRLAAHACNVPVVVHTFHGHVFHSYFGKAKTRFFVETERYLARKSSGIIAISDIQKKELADTYRICPSDKIEVIPLGLDLDAFGRDGASKRHSFRNQFGFAEDELLITIVGRIVPVKNHLLFVKMAAEVMARTANPKLRFLIVGDGDSRLAMEEGFRNAGIAYSYFPETGTPAQATCISWSTEVDRVFNASDIVVLTSHNEGTPVSMIEAQATSKPVVCTNVGGVADIIEDGVTGYVVPRDDVPAFAVAVTRLVNDAALRQSMGQQGRDAVIQRFSYQRLVRDMDGYYRKLLGTKR
ncbi:MAG: glycosyltransferase family 1 protein [Sphingobacteriales bacterium]|nr:MAG: glycosyltransferase family 1 protein [Sphingobacteriales bacterium]